jgi:hypothetical protein
MQERSGTLPRAAEEAGQSAPPRSGESGEEHSAALRGEGVESLRQALEALKAVNASLLEREARLREMLLDAHDQLLERDDELQDLIAKLDEQAAWARRSSEEVSRRDEISRDLMERLDEQAAWARRSNDEVLRRDAIIQELSNALEEQSTLARQSADEVARRDGAIEELNQRMADLEAGLLALRLERDALVTDRWARETRLGELETTCAEQAELIQSIRGDLARAVAEIDRMAGTRLWRMGQAFWRVRAWPGRAFRRVLGSADRD